MLSVFGSFGPPAEPGMPAPVGVRRLVSALDPTWARTDPPTHSGFGRLFPAASAPASAAGEAMAEARLDALADALTSAECNPSDDAGQLPVAYMAMARFLDNDAVLAADLAGTDGAQAGGRPANRRDGRLRLDSLYRCDAGDGPLARKLTRLMREPGAPARMRVDAPEPSPFGAPPLPADRGSDLLRLGRLLSDDPAHGVTEAEIMAAPPWVRAGLLLDGRPDPRRPITGDARVGSSLVLAQFHVALLRLHNAIVEWCAETGAVAPDALFAAARRLTQRHVQWLALNDFLPRLCDPRVLTRIRRAGAPLHRRLRAASDGLGAPTPLEFWAAAGRYRYSTVRARLDLNRFHGRAEGGAAPLTARAPLDLITHWSGAGMRSARMPAHMAAEWSRLAQDPPAFADRGVRRIDTYLVPSFGAAAGAEAEAFRGLARRTLRLGRRLGLASGQECAAGFNAVYDDLIRPLTVTQLTAGHTGEAVADGLADATPLWFYVLKEAEIQQGGERLGQLGSALLAETLIGALDGDRDSVLHAVGSGGLTWTPADGARPDGIEIDGLQAMFRAAGLM